MIYYRDYQTTPDHAYNMTRALDACRKKGAHTLVLDKGTYEFFPDKAAEAYYVITNHGYPGLKRIAFHLKDLHGLTVDGNGSKLIFHGVMCPFVVDGCTNVTIKNFTLDTPDPYILQGEITEVGDGYVDYKPELGSFTFKHGNLYVDTPMGEYLAYNPFCFRGDNYSIRENTSNFCFGKIFEEQRKELLENGNIRIYDSVKIPKLHDRIVIVAGRRFSSNIFIKDSKNTTVEDVTIHRGIGMGVVAQHSENITLRRYETHHHGTAYFSANADATHFNNCKGHILLEDCFFENQLDDGLNIHGIYTKVEEKTDNSLLLRYMHEDARGIEIYTVGDTVATSDPDSLISNWEGKITAVEHMNLDYVRLTVDTSTEGVRVGDVLENLSTNADLTVRNCTMRNNKCRGMLIGTSGKVLVEGCTFHNAGCGIKFECDGTLWYESGPVRDVTIRNNTFDHCKNGGRDTAIIACQPRNKVEEGRYYHKNITITDNLFITDGEPVLAADNIDGLIYKNNRVTNPTPDDISVKHCINVCIEE